MPLYDYECKGCSRTFTDVKKIDDRHQPCEEPCSECGGEIVLRVGASTFIYNRAGAIKTSDNFNDRLKEIRNRTPEKYKQNVEKSIR